MKVTLLHHTPLVISATGARTCWASGDKSDSKGMNCGSKDAELVDRVGNKFHHASILEHISYNLRIEGVSRALLQELARHRIASLSVESTRYTLKKLKSEEPFYNAGKSLAHLEGTAGEGCTMDDLRAEKYLVYTGDPHVDFASLLALENLRVILIAGISNDRAKYCLPEAYKTELIWTINLRSLQNFLFLRSDKTALWEIRDLANAVYQAIPEDHKYLLEGSMR